MHRERWEREARGLMGHLVQGNKRPRGGTCPVCGAERFHPCYTGCAKALAKHLLDVEVTNVRLDETERLQAQVVQLRDEILELQSERRGLQDRVKAFEGMFRVLRDQREEARDLARGLARLLQEQGTTLEVLQEILRTLTKKTELPDWLWEN